MTLPHTSLITELCSTATCNVYVFVPSVSQKPKSIILTKTKSISTEFWISLKPSISQNKKASQLNFMPSDSNKLGWMAKIQQNRSSSLCIKQMRSSQSLISVCSFISMEIPWQALSVYVCPMAGALCMPFCVYCASMCVVCVCLWMFYNCVLSVCLSMFCNFVFSDACESVWSPRDETDRETFGCKEKRCEFDRQYMIEVIMHYHYHMLAFKDLPVTMFGSCPVM